MFNPSDLLWPLDFIPISDQKKLTSLGLFLNLEAWKDLMWLHQYSSDTPKSKVTTNLLWHTLHSVHTSYSPNKFLEYAISWLATNELNLLKETSNLDQQLLAFPLHVHMSNLKSICLIPLGVESQSTSEKECQLCPWVSTCPWESADP